ncbi:MAG: S-layer homology domain-containing protein [bacterium]
MINLRFTLALLISMIFVSFCAAAPSKLNVTSPVDKARIWSARASIDGTAPGAKKVYINGTKVELEKAGRIHAIALLKPGKNVVKVTAIYPGARTLSKKIRVLRMVTCNDIEKLFNGKQHWAKQQIVTLLTLGIIEGYPDNTFLPEEPLSRGEFATWLTRAKQLKRPKPADDVFFDVPKEHWRASYIKAVMDAGYMTGVTPDRFGINEKISRGEAVAAVAKANNLAPLKLSKSPFYDVPPDFKDAAYIYSAYNKGWITGYPGKVKKYEPEKDVTRGEIAVLLSRLETTKKLKASMYDFEKGYTAYQFSKINTRPVINKVVADPLRLAADGKTPLKLSADVADAQGKADISQVWADITSLGGPNNAKMNLIESGSYEISFIMTTETTPGEKNITVKASDKSGLISESSVKISVIREKR